MNSSDFTDQVVELVHRWLRESAGIAPDAAAQQLADLLRDPAGLTFTVGFVDGVIRPEDRAVAAANLTALARQSPRFLPSTSRPRCSWADLPHGSCPRS